LNRWSPVSLPNQLPPIVQSGNHDALQWFGHSIFSWLGINDSSLDSDIPMTLLRTQYRMTNPIGEMVSRLSYTGRLIHGRSVSGVRPMLVDVPPMWQTRLWSVRGRSTYQSATIPILHALIHSLGGEKREMLLLSPFRAQESLLSALWGLMALQRRRRRIL
jgi:hypothetical protein